MLGDEIEVAPETRLADLPNWDSLAQINVMFGLEEAFGIQFGDEFTAASNIAEIQVLLDEKGVTSP